MYAVLYEQHPNSLILVLSVCMYNNNNNNNNYRLYLVYWPVINKSSAVNNKIVFVLFVHLI